jgi:hypothetical protein
MTTTTLPACLTRTSRDDKREAGYNSIRWSSDLAACEAALAEIQRREVEAVEDFSAPLCEIHAGKPAVTKTRSLLAQAAMQASEAAAWMCYVAPIGSLEQRGQALDHARGLVALALEVTADA